MERPPYIPDSTFEELATQQRRKFNAWNQSNAIALNALQYIEFLVNEQGLQDWQFKKLNPHYDCRILGKYDILENVIWIEESLQKYPTRLAFTIVHECEHFLKHRWLFESEIQNHYMFSTEKQEFVCFREDIAGRPTGDMYRKRIEWQANHGAACLLLPLQEVREDIAQQATPHEIAQKYDVSYQTTEIRIEQLNKTALSNTITNTSLAL